MVGWGGDKNLGEESCKNWTSAIFSVEYDMNARDRNERDISHQPALEREPINSAIGMGKDSIEFLEAAEKLLSGQSNSFNLPKFMFPAYLLVCHSIEISLKSYLRAKGLEDVKLKKLGHDLNACLTAATAEGLVVSQEFSEVTGWLAPYHSDHAFRYHKERYMRLPAANDLLRCVEAQIRKTFELVDSIIRSHLRVASTQRRQRLFRHPRA